MRTTKAILLFLLAAFLFFAACVHSQQGWSEISTELQLANISSDLFDTLQMGWYFGSFAFMAFGCLLLHQAVQIVSQEKTNLVTLSVVGWVLIAFGTLGVLSKGPSIHYGGFIAVGVLVAIVAALPDGKRAP